MTATLTVVKPRFVLPLCTLLWSFFVLFMYKVESAKDMYILRSVLAPLPIEIWTITN